MRFAIEGLIENVGAADIFLFLSQTQRTSVVAFERADQETRVYFVEGQPVWSTSTKVQLQLESRLASGGAIKLRDIEAALGRQKASANRVPQALIAELMATEASMEKDLRALALDALRDVATWTNGTFTVFDGVVPPPWTHTITPDFPTLLLEALRGQCQKEALQREFISRKGILRARATHRTQPNLNDAERVVLALVNGERTIEEIVKRSGLDEFQALSAMHVLCALHLTDLLPAQRSSSKPTTDRVSQTPQPAATPAPTPVPVAAAPPDQGLIDRGGATDRYTGTSDPKPAPPTAEAAPKPEGGPRTSESTAKLPVLQSLGPPKEIVRILRVTSDDRTEDVHLKGTTFAIGRHPRNDLVLKDPRISSFHCRVEIEGDKYMLLDLKSRNGTMVNGARIDRAPLKHGDLIQLGSTKVTYIES